MQWENTKLFTEIVQWFEPIFGRKLNFSKKNNSSLQSTYITLESGIFDGASTTPENVAAWLQRAFVMIDPQFFGFIGSDFDATPLNVSQWLIAGLSTKMRLSRLALKVGDFLRFQLFVGFLSAGHQRQKHRRLTCFSSVLCLVKTFVFVGHL